MPLLKSGFLMSHDTAHLSCLMGKTTMWFPNRYYTNWDVQAQKMARCLKFWIEEEEGLYYPCSENKGADQLRSYCEADLRLCFRLDKLFVFPCGGSFILCSCACNLTFRHPGRTEEVLVATSWQGEI